MFFCDQKPEKRVHTEICEEAEINDSSIEVTSKFFVNCLYARAIIPKNHHNLNDGTIILFTWDQSSAFIVSMRSCISASLFLCCSFWMSAPISAQSTQEVHTQQTTIVQKPVPLSWPLCLAPQLNKKIRRLKNMYLFHIQENTIFTTCAVP